MAISDGQMPSEAVESLADSFSDSFSEFSAKPDVIRFLEICQDMRKSYHTYATRVGPHSDIGAPTPQGRILDTPIVDLVLSSGTRETHYAIHKGILEYHSLFFRAALSETWHDSPNPTLEITGHDKETVAVFRDYIYFGDSRGVNVTSTNTNKDIRLLINAWIFADKYVAPGFQNWCIDRIFWSFTGPRTAKLDSACPYEYFDYLTKYTAPTSKIRRLFIDIAAAVCTPLEGPRLDDASGPMFAQLLQLLLQKSQHTALKVLWIRLCHPCYYHRHDDEDDECSVHVYSDDMPAAWFLEDVLPRLDTCPVFENHPDIQQLAKSWPNICTRDFSLPRWTAIPGISPAGHVFELLAKNMGDVDNTELRFHRRNPSDIRNGWD